MPAETTEKKPVRNGVLYMRLADEILAYIRDNHIRSGERIPSERRLAEIFSTSRASIREAVRVLQNKNILEVQIGNGMFVKSGLTEGTIHIELWKIDYMEILELKTLLEYSIIAQLCEYISPADLHAIEQSLTPLERAYARGVFDQKADYQFHQKIRSCCKNLTLVQLLDNLLVKLDEYSKEMAVQRRAWYHTVPLHRELYEAIRDHDVERAHTVFYEIFEIDKRALEE
ncbi:MAG: FadR family transcriptional regulator [Lachnospiraceae bacterium]|nr:FadR family transcriptional regulator [Lachnospiraceae bacterium]